MRDRVIVLLALVVGLMSLAIFLALMHVRHLAMDMRQRAQLASVAWAAELFESTFGQYPPSDANDMVGVPYGGAMKLVEAMVGQDRLGFHPESVFRSDGLDPKGLVPLYSPDTVQIRPGVFLPVEHANLHRLVDIFGKGNTGPFREDQWVMCDIFEKDRPGGIRTGMPILYYRADTLATLHDANDPDNPQNIYDYRDNLALIKLGVPGRPGQTHPLAEPRRFYLNTRSDKAGGTPQPNRANSYILISAGYDGLYGTADDICNFDWTYRER